MKKKERKKKKRCILGAFCVSDNCQCFLMYSTCTLAPFETLIFTFVEHVSCTCIICHLSVHVLFDSKPIICMYCSFKLSLTLSITLTS